jgi:hypothetical protein
VFHLDGAAAPDAHAFPFQRLQPPFRQRPQVRHLLGDLRRPARIALFEHAEDELPVVGAAGKIPAATQQQGLLHRLLEMSVQRFHVAILMPAGGIGCLALQAVMVQQRSVPSRELFRLAVVMHRQGQAIGAVPLGHGP